MSDTSTHPMTRLREAQPLVQCVTNVVVTPFTANALLALGAAPAMVDLPVEAGMFAEVASGVLVNLGTPHAEQREAALEAAGVAQEHETPWVLDPVAIGSLPIRTRLAHQLLAHRPDVVRGNASEVLALAGAGTGGRGVDATVSSEEVVEAAGDLAVRSGGVVAVSGEVDVVTDGNRVERVVGGSVLLTRVTGGGCALGAAVAAFAGAGLAPFDAALAAHRSWAVASERAAALASGPGSFAVAFLDALADLDDADVR